MSNLVNHAKKELEDRINWWERDENKDFYQLPVSVIKSDQGLWVASTNDDTKEVLGERVSGCASGSTKEEAMNQLMTSLRVLYEFSEERRLKYQRWVPFIKGPWGRIGGNWFTVFGINVYFRYGKNMKGGWYVPFTKLNIRVHSLWATYRRYKAKDMVFKQ